MASGKIENIQGKSYALGESVNILPYNSTTNLFTAPSDGYVLAQVWNDNSTIDLWIGRNALSVPLRNNVVKAYSVYAKKGVQFWLGGSGSNRSAYFMPLV